MVMVRGDEGRGHTRQVARVCCSQQFSTHPPLFALHQPGIDATRLGGGHTNDLRGRSAGAAATRSRGARCGGGAQHLVSPALSFRPTVGRSCGGRRPRTGEAECGAAADRRRPGEGRQRAGEAHGRVGESGTCWRIGSGVDRGAPLPYLFPHSLQPPQARTVRWPPGPSTPPLPAGEGDLCFIHPSSVLVRYEVEQRRDGRVALGFLLTHRSHTHAFFFSSTSAPGALARSPHVRGRRRFFNATSPPLSPALVLSLPPLGLQTIHPPTCRRKASDFLHASQHPPLSLPNKLGARPSRRGRRPGGWLGRAFPR